VYGAVVCSYDAVSLFYLELYVKLSICLSIYCARFSTWRTNIQTVLTHSGLQLERRSSSGWVDYQLLFRRVTR
jgi:hypothetical protein